MFGGRERERDSDHCRRRFQFWACCNSRKANLDRKSSQAWLLRQRRSNNADNDEGEKRKIFWSLSEGMQQHRRRRRRRNFQSSGSENAICSVAARRLWIGRNWHWKEGERFLSAAASKAKRKKEGGASCVCAKTGTTDAKSWFARRS